MNNKPNSSHKKKKPTLIAKVGAKANSRLKAQQDTTPGVWRGLGAMGLIGWSIVVPTLVGAMIGIWIDKHYSGTHTWALSLLVAGLSIGCLNAWHWIDKEEKEITKPKEGGVHKDE